MSTSAIDRLVSARRLRLIEILPWLLALGVFVLLPDYLQLGTQVLEMILFALSLDLLLGYTGIVTLGHAAYYGAGAYTAGLLAVAGWTEPLTGLLAGTAVSAILGLLSGAVILRTTGLALLMLGLATTLLLGEVANTFGSVTGGADGLQGIATSPILGRFSFDMFGRVGFLYALVVLFLAWVLVRAIVTSPFGRTLVGIRQNPTRMRAIGVSVYGRRLAVFTISAALAGLAGALAAQTTQFVTLDVFSVDLSGAVLLVLIIGGPGRLYGAFAGATVYFVAQDWLAKQNPVFWNFWLGLIVIAIVLFVRGGLLGLADAGLRRLGVVGRASA